jgi:hypothetical protein
MALLACIHSGTLNDSTSWSSSLTIDCRAEHNCAAQSVLKRLCMRSAAFRTQKQQQKQQHTASLARRNQQVASGRSKKRGITEALKSIDADYDVHGRCPAKRNLGACCLPIFFMHLHAAMIVMVLVRTMPPAMAISTTGTARFQHSAVSHEQGSGC